MENLYNRVENLDEQIRSVKLPYFAWKVLFCVSNNSEIREISRLLEAEEKEVMDSLGVLVSNGLIFEQPSKEEADAPKEQPDEVQEETVEEPEMEESAPETVAEEPDEEEAEQAEPEEEKQDEAEVEVDESKEQEDEETSELEIDDIEEATPEKDVHDELEMEEAGENLLDELVEENEETAVEEETIETEEPESAEDESAIETEEEKIEINIPEGEEESTEDLEFNFNLTGDDEVEQKEEVEEKPAEPPVQEVDTSGFKKILVIDDSLVIRKMVEIALEEEELKIETAVSGKEGLEIMDQTNPDLVILDMMLPDINGIEILKTIKASKGIPVIMLSGKDSPQMVETAKNEGAEEFLPKPFKDDDLVEKIKKLLDA